MIRSRPLALVASMAFTVVAAGVGLAIPQRAEAAAPPPVDPVIQWNRTLLQILRRPGAQPATVHPTRSLAMVHLAIYDAVNAIERTGAPYGKGIAAPKHASAVAAADEAAHDTLVGLDPTRKADLEVQLRGDLATIKNGTAERQGVAVGQAAAHMILTMRTGDGSEASPPPLPAGTTPGSYRPTPPNFVQPGFTHWPKVTPFALTKANQFRPGQPPALTSPTYTKALQEVQQLGDVNTAGGHYGAGSLLPRRPQHHQCRCGRDLAVRLRHGQPQILGAIRSAAWCAAIVQQLLGNGAGGGLSRIYAGQHTRVDHVAGVELGRDVANYVLRHDLQRVR